MQCFCMQRKVNWKNKTRDQCTQNATLRSRSRYTVLNFLPSTISNKKDQNNYVCCLHRGQLLHNLLKNYEICDNQSLQKDCVAAKNNANWALVHKVLIYDDRRGSSYNKNWLQSDVIANYNVFWNLCTMTDSWNRWM